MADDAEVNKDANTDSVPAKANSQVPNDAELKRVTLAFLGAADLEQITKKTVRRSLENKLGVCHARPYLLDDGLSTPSVSFRAWFAN